MRQRDITIFWLPLFASWLLMTAEGPLISAAINRLPGEVVMLAAMGIVTSLSVTIESPIINLLATSTALVKDYNSYLLVRRFTLHWCLGLTIVAAAIAFTPLFDFVVLGLLDLPAEIANWVRPGLRIMVFWTAAIGWRRFLQGILIRFGRTRQVAWGTAIRLAASGGTVLALAIWGQLSGVIVGAIGLMSGVVAEAAYATLAARPVIARELSPERGAATPQALTYRTLFWFHLPLAATSLLILLVQPLVTSSLARLEEPALSLSAWPVLFQIMLVARAAALALPEVVIALYRDGTSFGPLRRFNYTLTLVVTALTVLFVATPLSEFYVFRVQDMTAATGAMVLSSLGLFVLFPGLAVLISWLRGILIETRNTRYVNLAMAVNLATTAAVLLLGVANKWPGLTVAAVALNLAAVAEVVVLTRYTQRILPQEARLIGRARTQPTPP